MKKYVIIGNSIAAIGCIEGIRSVDTKGGITVISEEKHPVYGRPLISYYLQDKTDEKRMNYRSEDFYESNKCKVIYGKKAVRIDSEAKEVILDNGKKIEYDALCVATGSRPFVPPFEGLETVSKKYSFMTLDDAIELKNNTDESTKVLIRGAGLIGLKCAEGLCGRVGSITVCDLADRVLSSILDAECAEIMQKNLEEHGVEFMLSDSVIKFDGGTAIIKSGKKVDFDVLVLAVGVRANTELLKESGGKVDRGIIVDEKMATDIDSVYSAGDCTQGMDITSGENKVLAILPNAYLQGHTAGVNMAGGDEVFDKGIPMNSIGFFGLHAMTAGAYVGAVYEEKTDKKLKRLFVKDGLLKGFIIIGSDTERAGIYTSLIREQTPLNDIDIKSMQKIASNMIFSSEIRRKKFGGVV